MWDSARDTEKTFFCQIFMAEDFTIMGNGRKPFNIFARNLQIFGRFLNYIKVFKNRWSKICRRQPLKKSKWYGLTILLQFFFKGCLLQILLGPFLNTWAQIHLCTVLKEVMEWWNLLSMWRDVKFMQLMQFIC